MGQVRDIYRYRYGPSTGGILTAHTDFFHGTAERLHLRKSWHGTANRGAETDVFGSARHG